MPAASYHNRPSKKHGNFGIGSLKIFDFLKSDFSYLPLGKTRKVGCLKIQDFSESDLSYLALGKTGKLDEKKPAEKSTISEVSTWPSRSAELYGRVFGGKLGAPGVKWVQLFLMYLYSWSPRGTHLLSQTLISLRPISRRLHVVVFVKPQILNKKHSQKYILLFLPFPLCLSAAFSCNSIFKLLNKTFLKLKNKKKCTHEYRIKKVILNL